MTSLSHEAREKLYRRIDESAKRAVQSMCAECLGERYNRPGSKTPLSLSEEMSIMTGTPQLETVP